MSPACRTRHPGDGPSFWRMIGNPISVSTVMRLPGHLFSAWPLNLFRHTLHIPHVNLSPAADHGCTGSRRRDRLRKVGANFARPFFLSWPLPAERTLAAGLMQPVPRYQLLPLFLLP